MGYRKTFLVSLLGFNVGVELGQLAVVALAFGVVAFIRYRPWYRTQVVRPASGDRDHGTDLGRGTLTWVGAKRAMVVWGRLNSCQQRIQS